MEPVKYWNIASITLSGVVALFGLRLAIIGRRNTLREHLYKEQMLLIIKLISKLSKLNDEADILLNKKSSRLDNQFEAQVADIQQIIYESSFILPDQIIGKFNAALESAKIYYRDFLSTNEDRYKISYKNYYNKYASIVEDARRFLGVNKLSSDNLKLFEYRDL